MNNGEQEDVVQCQCSTNMRMCNCIIQLASAGDALEIVFFFFLCYFFLFFLKF